MTQTFQEIIQTLRGLIKNYTSFVFGYINLIIFQMLFVIWSFPGNGGTRMFGTNHDYVIMSPENKLRYRNTALVKEEETKLDCITRSVRSKSNRFNSRRENGYYVGLFDDPGLGIRMNILRIYHIEIIRRR
jgi:hypothetical protein